MPEQVEKQVPEDVARDGHDTEPRPSDLAGGIDTARAPGGAPFSPPPQLTDEIGRILREQIMVGRFREGERLNMDRLAREFGTSTTPIREVLLALNSEGFVDFQPRKGFRVASMRRADIEDIALLLRTVAGELAARAVRWLSDEDVEHLQALQNQMVDAQTAGETGRVEDLDLQFHRLINRAAPAPKLRWMLGTLARYFPQSSYSLVPGWSDAAMQHDNILAALVTRNPELARGSVAEHLNVAKELLLGHLTGFGTLREDGSEGPVRDDRHTLPMT